MTRLYRAGLILLGLLSLVSLTSPLTTDGQHPPMMIALIDAGVGLIGIGLFTSVPQTCLLFLTAGWVAARQADPISEDGDRFKGSQPGEAIARVSQCGVRNVIAEETA